MKSFYVLFVLLLFACPVFADVESPEIDLRQWGIENPSQISYVSASVVEGPEGKKLAIYDLRKQKPQILSVPASQTVSVFKDRIVKKTPLKQAMWLWETTSLLSTPEQVSALLGFARRQKISDIFLQIPFTKNVSGTARQIPEAMRHLNARLHEAGIRVHALDGDPNYALEKNHASVLADIQRIIDYNNSVRLEERFDGVRYDTEIYLLPAFAGIQKQSYLKQYLALLEASYAITQKAGIPFGADIPFWYDERNNFQEPTAELEGRPFSEWVIDRVDNVGIMDYRTRALGSDGVVAQALKEMNYASQVGKEVFVGLETSALPDETLYDFEKCSDSKNSRVVIQTLAPHKVRLLWLSVDAKNSLPGSSLYLCETKRVVVASDKISFQKLTNENLQSVMQEAVKAFVSFPAFAGFAIHSYESYRPWLEKQGIR